MGPREPRAFKKLSDEALAARHSWNGFWRTVHSRRFTHGIKSYLHSLQLREGPDCHS